ncbi:MAG: DNA cytosine methyltransferase [Candidatus Thiodiazotropha taylori]|nr:DNA cytosine methyltransferase [Candidatus Thiodiazotropha taylori]
MALLKFVDLFCGGGFGARGAVRAGGRPILAVDAWDIAASTYKDNFPSAEVICSHIEKLSPDKLAKQFKPDVLLTSPECTSHSVARGARPASERSRETAIGIVPWLRSMSPPWLIVENVKRMKMWDRHNELIKTIESYGYTVSDLCLNAADFGAPQSRERMFLICNRFGTVINKDELMRTHKKKYKDAASIIDWSGRYKSQPLYKDRRAKATLERAERAIDYLGRGIPFIVVYYGTDGSGGWQTTDVPLRTVTTLDRFGLVTWEKTTPFLRMLQPPELQRAMGAGLTHELNYGNRRDKIKLCGNGVCSPVMEVIFRRISKINTKQK